MKLKNKTITILEELFRGRKVKLSYGDIECEFYWCEDRLHADFEGIKPLTNEKFIHTVGFPDLSLSDFVKMCEKKTDDEIFIINTNEALRKININRNGKGERKNAGC